MNGLALCAGIGGLELGVRLAVGSTHRTVCYVEREAYAASILVQRMEEGILDQAPIWSDLSTFDGRPWRGRVDLVSAGFPCQPWSSAGKRQGTEDERWIWDEIARILRELGPRYVFLENVPGLIRGGVEHVLRTLAEGGWDAEWDLFRPEDLGAPHRRERLFCLAYRPNEPRRLPRQPRGRKHVAHRNDRKGHRQQEGSKQEERGWTPDGGTQLGDARSVDGQARRSDEAHSKDGVGSRPEHRREELGHTNGEGLEGFLPGLCGGNEIPPWPPGPEASSTELSAASSEPLAVYRNVLDPLFMTLASDDSHAYVYVYSSRQDGEAHIIRMCVGE